MSTTIGSPIIVGTVKGVNRFSFIFFLKEWVVLVKLWV